MSDFDLGYYFYEHDKGVEEKELESSGASLVSTGILLVILSFFLLIIFRRTEVLLLTIGGMAVILLGKDKQSRVLQIRPTVKPPAKVNVELHHRAAEPRIIFPSRQVAEGRLISRIISQNSGSDINTIFRLYRAGGGTYDAERFVKAVHRLKKSGVVDVRKTISQTSFIPSTST